MQKRLEMPTERALLPRASLHMCFQGSAIISSAVLSAHIVGRAVGIYPAVSRELPLLGPPIYILKSRLDPSSALLGRMAVRRGMVETKEADVEADDA